MPWPQLYSLHPPRVHPLRFYRAQGFSITTVQLFMLVEFLPKSQVIAPAHSMAEVDFFFFFLTRFTWVPPCLAQNKLVSTKKICELTPTGHPTAA